MTQNRPNLDYLIANAESWAHEEDSPTYYAVLKDENGEPFDVAIEPHEIAAQDARVLEVLENYYTNDDYAHMRDSLGEIWGSVLRDCVCLWDESFIPFVINDELIYISEVINLKQLDDCYVDMSVNVFRSAQLPSSLKFAHGQFTQKATVTKEWLTQHFENYESKMTIARGLGLSSRETAMYLRDKKNVFNNDVLPHDILAG